MKKRLTIAVFIPQLHYYYQNHIWRNACKAAEKKDVNLLFFITNEIKPNYSYAYMYNSLFPLVNSPNIDGILLGASMGTFISEEDLSEFIKSISGKPIATFSFSYEPYPAALVDGKAGIRQAVEHLIYEHNVREIAFVCGPDTNPEARERYQAYWETIEKAGLKPRKELVLQGTFLRQSGYQASVELLERRKLKPEAIICANDEMAFGVMDFLYEKDIKVPEDIKIIGFDNLEESRYVYPSLSTVAQPFEALMDAALDKLVNFIRGEEQERVSVFPTRFIPRESCGCGEDKELERYIGDSNWITGDEISIIKPLSSHSPEELYAYKKELKEALIAAKQKENAGKYMTDFLTEYMKFLFSREINPLPFLVATFSVLNDMLRNSLLSTKEYDFFLFIVRFVFSDFYRKLSNKNNLMIRTERVSLGFFVHDIAASLDFSELRSVLAKGLIEFSISDCFIALYNGPVQWDGNLKWTLPDTATVIFDYHRGQIVAQDRLINREEYIPSHFFDNVRSSGAIFPIVYRDQCFGYIVFSPLPRDEILLDSIHKNISSAIKACLLIKEVNEGKERIIEANKKLEELSITDEQTGVYNRRGFFSVSDHLIASAKRRKKQVVVFFFDLNWLKDINDTFGHAEGDYAIRIVSDTLKKTFRATDIIGRFGGDEFVVLSVDCEVFEASAIAKRVDSKLEEFNRNSGKPYILSVSYGTASMLVNKAFDLEELIDKADMELYAYKKAFKEKYQSCLKSAY
ncbi:GGDEF domain-containing protein [Spirochaetia bacterium 38H-sp]|uniref:GGDEF domain-containing protein n=1 Tax=Rarispira pelagica TaxID=3141764 RepID=A0ABU9UCP3_9SPIR